MKNNSSDSKMPQPGHWQLVTTGDLVTLCPGDFPIATEKGSNQIWITADDLPDGR